MIRTHFAQIDQLYTWTRRAAGARPVGWLPHELISQSLLTLSLAFRHALVLDAALAAFAVCVGAAAPHFSHALVVDTGLTAIAVVVAAAAGDVIDVVISAVVCDALLVHPSDPGAAILLRSTIGDAAIKGGA